MNTKPPRVIRLVTLSIIILTIIGIAIVGVVAYWSFTGTDVLKFSKDPIPVKPKFVKSEGEITLDVEFCKLTSTAGRVTQRLVSNSTEIFAPTVIDNQPKGCYNYPLKIAIPTQTPPGKYHINYRVTYNTNPFHTVTEEINSESFDIE